jgi:hypothetical protein
MFTQSSHRAWNSGLGSLRSCDCCGGVNDFAQIFGRTLTSNVGGKGRLQGNTVVPHQSQRLIPYILTHVNILFSSFSSASWCPLRKGQERENFEKTNTWEADLRLHLSAVILKTQTYPYESPKDRHAIPSRSTQ